MTAEVPNPLDVPDVTEPYQPRSGQRGSGFLTDPFQLGTTPSATVGPYLAIGLTWPDGVWAAAEGTEGGFWIRGRVFDGAGDLVPDAMVETWQADPEGRFDTPEDPRGASEHPGFRGFARSHTSEPPGEFGVFTLKPGRVPDGEGGLQAPHIDVSVFARGMLDRVVTRIYFADEAEANAEDAVLRGLTDAQRRTLIAERTDEGYRFDVHLQGDDETVFFAV
jgi:protocatechuate 3,4-dioxygenase alpha subunit